MSDPKDKEPFEISQKVIDAFSELVCALDQHLIEQGIDIEDDLDDECDTIKDGPQCETKGPLG